MDIITNIAIDIYSLLYFTKQLWFLMTCFYFVHFLNGHPARIDESDFENMNPTVIKWTFAIALTAPLLFFALKLIHL